MNNKLFIGDSNVYIFEYFRKFGAHIIKFKGAPIKGIVNKNENYITILNSIKRLRPTDLFLIFGVVDLNFLYYFKKYKENKTNVFEEIQNYVKNYVKIVYELDVKNKYIIGILASPIGDKYFRNALSIYGIMTEEIAKTIPEYDLLMVTRNKRIEIINNILEEECKKYNINFCNIFPFITKEYKLQKVFSLEKISRYNIHHRYEYLLIIFICTCFKFLIEDKNFENIMNELKLVNNTYIKDKIYSKKKNDSYDSYNSYNSYKTKEERDALYKITKFSKKKILKFVKNNLTNL